MILAACVIHFEVLCADGENCKVKPYDKIFTGVVIKKEDEHFEISTNALDTERVMIPIEDCVIKEYLNVRRK